VYSGKYFQVKANSMEPIAFSHHPNETTLADLNDMKQLLLDRSHQAKILVEDFRGKKYATKRFLFRENA
jgi:hypothetical protein